jgi:hypothetical protein
MSDQTRRWSGSQLHPLSHQDGRELTGRPLRDRRAQLEIVVAGSEFVLPVRRLATNGFEAWAQVIAHDYDGLVAKEEASLYEPGPTTATGYAQTLKEIEPAAKAFKMQLQFIDVLHAKDMETAFQAASEGRAQGVLTLNSAILGSERAQIVELAVKKRLPVMGHRSEFVEAGGLCFTA